MKKILFLALVTMFFAGCQNSSKTEVQSEAQLPAITVDEFFASPETYLDREVTITGLVTHVCKHGGQKLFLTGTGTPESIRINTSETIPEFGIELEGSRTQFQGTVKIMDENIIAEAEAEEATHHPEQGSEGVSEDLGNRNKAYYIIASSFKAVN